MLDRLLEHPQIEVEVISGTSAGAMNAAVLIAGLCDGGNAGARERRADFWRHASLIDRFSPVRRTFWEWFNGGYTLERSPGLAFMKPLTRTLSPYQVNPLNFNPLRSILENLIDFETLRHAHAAKLFILATNVVTGRARIFENSEMTPDVLLASACLPQMFQAVEIDGAPLLEWRVHGEPGDISFMIYGAETRAAVVTACRSIERVDQRCDLHCQSAAQTPDGPDAGSPFCACRLLVDGDDGAINQGVFQIGITTYGFEKTLENSTISPATKSAASSADFVAGLIVEFSRVFSKP